MANLSPVEFARVKQRLQPVLGLKNLRPLYDLAPGVTDQATAMLYLRSGSREVATQVYGLSEGEDGSGASTRFGKSAPTPPPSQVFQLHKWLCALNFPKSRLWQPRYVEMMLWDYSYAPEKSLQWPSNWPSLSSKRAIKRGDAYSIFLDGSELPRINTFLARRKERGAVALGGKKWAVEHRFTFPNEPLWSRAFARASARSRGGA